MMMIMRLVNRCLTIYLLVVRSWKCIEKHDMRILSHDDDGNDNDYDYLCFPNFRRVFAIV